MADTKQTAHTPTPWVVVNDVDYPMSGSYGISSQIGDGTSFRVANTDIDDFDIPQQRANAAYIVRCVNSHEVLVEALKAFTSAMRKGERPELLDLINALHVADAALKQAGGE